MSYQQLSAAERIELYRLKQSTNVSIRGIAKKMGRSHSTISRELRRNQVPQIGYLPDTAQCRAEERRRQSKQRFEKVSFQIREKIQSGLKAYYSPEQIAGRLKRKGVPGVSHETIYQMIYQNYQEMGSYAKYLRQSHRQRRRRRTQGRKRGLIPNRVGIEHRPAPRPLRRRSHRG